MTPLHIAYLTDEYPPGPTGGIGTSIRNLGRALVRRGHRVTVVGWGADLRLDDCGVDVRLVPSLRAPKLARLLNRWRAAAELNRLVGSEGLQIVEAPDWSGLSAGMRLRCPLVIRCNGSATYFGHLLGESVRPRLRTEERQAIRGADDVAAVSRFTGEETRRLFDLRRPVRVIPNGIDVEQFRCALPDEVEPDTILYFGSLIRKKGVLDLPAIFAEVAARRPAARLRLVGRDCWDTATNSPSTWSLVESALDPKLRDRVEWLGPQPYDSLQEHVRRAAVCAFPSYAEAFPLSWLEAMACGKPVVAYGIGWAPEAIEHGLSGMLVPPGDAASMGHAIADILDDRELAAALGERARLRVCEHFTADRVADLSLDWYASVVGRG